MEANNNDWGVFIDEKFGNIIHVYPINEQHSQEIISGTTPPPISDCSC